MSSPSKLCAILRDESIDEGALLSRFLGGVYLLISAVITTRDERVTTNHRALRILIKGGQSLIEFRDHIS